MATFTEIVAAVVVHSSAAAYSHFGLAVEAPKVEHPTQVSERVIARTPRRPEKLAACPDRGQPRQLRILGDRA
ncbi:MAG: hypothetical protein JWO33_2009 [Caulobacteraceae bacterium]|nr:hypothetical protein [Caulobacteraceae bacterium]